MDFIDKFIIIVVQFLKLPMNKGLQRWTNAPSIKTKNACAAGEYAKSFNIKTISTKHAPAPVAEKNSSNIKWPFIIFLPNFKYKN